LDKAWGAAQNEPKFFAKTKPVEILSRFQAATAGKRAKLALTPVRACIEVRSNACGAVSDMTGR
jgi:hypothetical protein